MYLDYRRRTRTGKYVEQATSLSDLSDVNLAKIYNTTLDIADQLGIPSFSWTRG